MMICNNLENTNKLSMYDAINQLCLVTYNLTTMDVQFWSVFACSASLWKPFHPHLILILYRHGVQVGLICPFLSLSPCRWTHDPGQPFRKHHEYSKANQYLWGGTKVNDRRECISQPSRTTVLAQSFWEPSFAAMWEKPSWK